MMRRFHLPLLTLASVLLIPAAVSPAASPGKPENAKPLKVRSIRELSRQVMAPKWTSSPRADEVRELRAALVRLRDSLGDMERGATAGRIESVRERRESAGRIFESLRGRFPRPAAAPPSDDLEARMSAVWREVDAALRASQRRGARIDAARQLIGEALEKPTEVNGPSYKMLFDASDERRR